ncbi:MAG: hypothetical protein IT522_01020 [Burkholderiales bacterium]|nr:hypothetical protein [Burkholderiales bacterium]
MIAERCDWFRDPFAAGTPRVGRLGATPPVITRTRWSRRAPVDAGQTASTAAPVLAAGSVAPRSARIVDAY